MRLIVLVLTLIISSQVAVAQDAMVKECEATATSNNDRAACARLAQCASQCGSDDSCLLSCTTPGQGAGNPSIVPESRPSVTEPALKRDKKADRRDRTDLCKQLYDYRDNQLETAFNVALTKQDLFKDRKEKDLVLAKDTLNLSNQEWLMGQQGAQIAIELKFFTDELSAFLKALAPEAEVVDFIEHVGISIGIVRSAVENGAKKASEDGAKEALWVLSEELSPLVAMEHGVLTRAENERGVEESKAEIQRQVSAIVGTARNWHNKELEAQSAAESIAKIKQRITEYCSAESGFHKQEPVDVTPQP